MPKNLTDSTVDVNAEQKKYVEKKRKYYTKRLWEIEQAALHEISQYDADWDPEHCLTGHFDCDNCQKQAVRKCRRAWWY